MNNCNSTPLRQPATQPIPKIPSQKNPPRIHIFTTGKLRCIAALTNSDLEQNKNRAHDSKKWIFIITTSSSDPVRGGDSFRCILYNKSDSEIITVFNYLRKTGRTSLRLFAKKRTLLRCKQRIRTGLPIIERLQEKNERIINNRWLHHVRSPNVKTNKRKSTETHSESA